MFISLKGSKCVPSSHCKFFVRAEMFNFEFQAYTRKMACHLRDTSFTGHAEKPHIDWYYQSSLDHNQ